jgi:hypothetical protein
VHNPFGVLLVVLCNTAVVLTLLLHHCAAAVSALQDTTSKQGRTNSMERLISICDLPESFLRQLCVQLPAHLQQRLRQTCRKLQQLMDAAAGVNLTWQQHCSPDIQARPAALHLPGVVESLVALNVECLGLTARGEAAQQAENKALATDIQRLGQLPRLTR